MLAQANQANQSVLRLLVWGFLKIFEKILSTISYRDRGKEANIPVSVVK
jgi:hypothetical protein